MPVLAALALALFPCVAPQDFKPDKQAYDAAKAQKDKGALSDAAGSYEALALTFPESALAPHSLVEAGVCWFTLGRDALELHRTTPKSREAFDHALGLFDRVTKQWPTEAVASRAQYMRGSTRLFAGEIELAEAAYDGVLANFAIDPNYVSKALERRAFTRRQLMRNADAIVDMRAYLERYPKGDAAAVVQQYLGMSSLLDKPAPPWVAETWVQGEPAPLELLGGQVVALYFFASWCPNCAKELPFIQDLTKRFAPKGVVFVGAVDHSRGQTADTVKKYLLESKIPFAVLMQSGTVSTDYGLPSIPHLVLIDRAGRVRWRDNPSNLVDWTVERLLAEDGHGAVTK
ncbi:MAG: redoxin family protein [Planctomycetes bacterium]|nr:redoxin family protein [Planctomycetota bacterium]